MLTLLFMFFFFFGSKTSLMIEACEQQEYRANFSIGVVIDESSRVGKEQKIGMEMAVKEDSGHCRLNLVLHVRDSKGNSARAASAVMKQKQVDAIVGTVTVEEASFISQLKSSISPNPIIISLSPSSSSSSPPKSPYFIHMSTSITYQTQCIAAIVAHFKWPKVILIHQQDGLKLHHHSSIFTHLSHSLRAVDSSIHHHLILPRPGSLSNPTAFVQGELEKLRRSDIKIFVVMQCSLELSVILFEKARVFGMMEKGFVWIVSDDQIGDLLDSVDESVTLNMQGVIGLKTDYADTTENFREFKSKFRRKYASEYPSEENSTPSIYSLRSYDAIRSVVEALNNSERKTNPTHELLLDHTDFEGLSGKISFNNGFLSQKPIFRIVNVIGRSYREIALWAPETSFTGKLSPIFWPGSETVVPKGWSIGSNENPLRIGVPANGAFNQFVKVTTNYDDQGQNLTQISGFSIDVFEAAVKQLPYDLYYEMVPYYGSYDEMVAEVHNKSLDAAVGDTEIMADRYVYAEFSQPYIESGLVMVVTVKHGLKESKFIALNPFTKRMWLQLLALSMLTGASVWFSEYATGNEQFTHNSFLDIISSVLWLSVTIISFSQKEHIKNSTSKVVLTVWICVVFVVAASFTAVLSSMMTVPRLQPSVEEIDYLRNTNAVVGCNGNSFIVRYLINVLHFKQENVKMLNSINEYPQAFKSGEIKAAFFVAPHAKVFLAEYCNDYVISGPSFKLGGFGFVFQRGSPLALDISEAILKVTQSGEVNTLEQNMLHLCNCTSSSSKQDADDIRLGPGPFSGMFQILGVVLGFVLFINIVRLLRIKWTSVYDLLQEVVMKKMNYIWAVLTEWYSRFGSTVFRQEIVEMNEVDAQMEPNLVEIQMTVHSLNAVSSMDQNDDSTPRL